jgi:hypothetical protein
MSAMLMLMPVPAPGPSQPRRAVQKGWQMLQNARLAVISVSLTHRTGPKVHAHTHLSTHVTRHAFSSRLRLQSAGTQVVCTYIQHSIQLVTLREVTLREEVDTERCRMQEQEQRREIKRRRMADRVIHWACADSEQDAILHRAAVTDCRASVCSHRTHHLHNSRPDVLSLEDKTLLALLNDKLARHKT